MEKTCDICKELIAKYDLGETLNALAGMVAGHIRVRGCAIRLLDEKNRTLEVAASYGLSREYLEKGPVKLEAHSADSMVLGGEIRSTYDIAEEEPPYLDEIRREGIKSVLSVPLSAGGRAIGILRAYSDAPRKFTADEIEQVLFFASIGGILIEKARTWDRLKALIEIARSISGTLSLDEVLGLIVRAAVTGLGVRAASIGILDREKNEVVTRAAFGLSDEYLATGPVPLEKSPLDRQCLECNVVSVPDIGVEDKLPDRDELAREGIAGMLCVPLAVRGSVAGVLKVYTSYPYGFRQEEMDFLNGLSCQGAVAMENARLFDRIKKEYRELQSDVWKWYEWGEHFPKKL
ncbi:MAG: GAF domain-containing protein [Nitrospiraceae bacterium]|nr:GAF domain-containing protein [Nitrospiraceae bacterium]